MEKFLMLLLHPTIAIASTYDNGLVDAFSKSAGLKTDTGATPIENTVAFFITIALGFIGIVLIVITLRAGILWMTAQDDKKVIENSKKTILGCAVGLFIALSSFAISDFIITNINKAEKNTFHQNANSAPTNPGSLSQTVCESNSQCPQEAPYCTGKGWYTANLGYCNCCDNNSTNNKCSDQAERKKYCQETYGAGYLCDDVGNGINTSCVKDCVVGAINDPLNCPSGQICKKTSPLLSHNECVTVAP